MKERIKFTRTPNNNLFTDPQKRSRDYSFGYGKGSKTNLVSGFTIIEILVVISIISLLTSIVLASLSEARAKARDAVRASALVEMYKATQLVHVEPAASFVGCVSSYAKVNTCTFPNLEKFHDPLRVIDSCNSASTNVCEYSVSDAEGGAVQGIPGIVDAPNTQNFEICAYLENGAGSYSKGLISIGSASGGVIVQGCR